jgi:hypothetical protein
MTADEQQPVGEASEKHIPLPYDIEQAAHLIMASGADGDIEEVFTAAYQEQHRAFGG